MMWGDSVTVRKSNDRPSVAHEVRRLRAALGESVSEFGARFERSGRTVEDWEQGRRRPDPIVMVLMRRLSQRSSA
jgi:DNA-binding transcriptional regulator YiaG